ncbi:unnamed protein product [Fusarium graminearum]|nr:hypothetical protein FG05_35029 [Fusarium graminearum]CAF3566174.1 unnamed protein product [Fusarium graminearum]CAG1976118.1 unnamed protein product [Fusarium graminearum]CAG2000646.1 unnamed protein product [Fusarium graminearum]VTO93219.1 unnamed protein product [Fusarium graminearum]
MPGKPSDWDNADFLLDLVVGLYTGAQTNKGLTPAIKESIEEYLKTRGYTTSFDAVRYVFTFSYFRLQVFYANIENSASFIT